MSCRQIFTHAISRVIRLVIALAIFGLSSAQASDGMHGKLCPSDVKVSLKQKLHDHSAQSVSHGSKNHTYPAADMTSSELLDGKFAKVQDLAPYSAEPAECCKSFCSSIALLDNVSVRDHIYCTAKLTVFAVRQLEAAAAAAIFTPPNA